MSKSVGFASVSTRADVERFEKAAKAFTRENTRTPEMAIKVLMDIGVLNSKGELKKSTK